MQGSDVSELAQYCNKIIVYDDYCEFITKDGIVAKIAKSEVPEGSFSKIDSLMPYEDFVSTYAKTAYEKIRSVGLSDVNAVSKNTGLTVEEVTKLKQHLFMDKHIIQKQGGLIEKF